MNIVFAGTPEFAAISLDALITSASHNIVAVYTQPDKPAGRGRSLKFSAVKARAVEHHIPVIQPKNFKSQHVVDELAALEPELMIVAAYGIILPRSVLQIPAKGCINIHASLLPRWRGAAPIHRAIEAGDEVTGITIMQMDEGLDTGAMLLKKPLNIAPTDTSATLHDRLAILGGEAILEALDSLANLKPKCQSEHEANYAKKLSKEEGKIDWRQPAEVIERKIRAFQPWPGAFFDDTPSKHIGKGTQTNSDAETLRVKVHEANVQRDEPGAFEHAPGTVVRRTREGIAIACADGLLNVTKLQPAGSRALTATDVINGRKGLLIEGSQVG